MALSKGLGFIVQQVPSGYVQEGLEDCDDSNPEIFRLRMSLRMV